MQKESNELALMRIYSTCDAGCDWTDKEQSSFCDAIVEYLSNAYPGVTVECEISASSETRVFVYGERQVAFVT